MEKTIPAFDARRQFGRVLRDVAGKGDRYVIERHGEPAAVVVPVEVYEQWKRARARVFAEIRAGAQRASLSEDEAYRLAAQAIEEVRGPE